MIEALLTQDHVQTFIHDYAQKNAIELRDTQKNAASYLDEIAAGKNMAFWPMGPLFRGSGVFFLRRSFKGMALYKKIFQEYLVKLLKDGNNIAFYIEGTRSRVGKLMRPKIGLLSMLMQAASTGACKDLYFVPIHIGYDRVLEENAYMEEMDGQSKKPESLRQMLSARKLLKKRYGKIYIHFSPPYSMRALLKNTPLPFHELDRNEQKQAALNVANHVLNAIDQLSVVTPHSLVAAALLNSPKRRISSDILIKDLTMYLKWIETVGGKIADTLTGDFRHSARSVLKAYQHQKVIYTLFNDHGLPQANPVFQVNEAKRNILAYYQNHSITYFVSPSLCAMCILALDRLRFTSQDILAEFVFLRNLFKYEFTYDPYVKVDVCLRKSIKGFIDAATLIPHPVLPNTYELTSPGIRKLKRYAGFAQSFLESYWIVAHYLSGHPQASRNPNDLMKQIAYYGQQQYRELAIDRIESLSRVTLRNAMDFFLSLGAEKGSMALKESTAKIQSFLGEGI